MHYSKRKPIQLWCCWNVWGRGSTNIFNWFPSFWKAKKGVGSEARDAAGRTGSFTWKILLHQSSTSAAEAVASISIPTGSLIKLFNIHRTMLSRLKMWWEGRVSAELQCLRLTAAPPGSGGSSHALRGLSAKAVVLGLLYDFFYLHSWRCC